MIARARGRRVVLTAAVALAATACGGPAPRGRPPAPPRSPALTASSARSQHGAGGTSHAGGQGHAPARGQGDAPARGQGDEPARGQGDEPARGQGDEPAGSRKDAAAAQPRERPFSAACAGDADCGYDPASERCGADPRLNRQPPVTDQGIVCYCDAGACARLRVLPVPCEGDHDCAVAHEPRAHPVRATRERPHEKGRPCRDLTLSTTCERTNICTLHRHACPGR
ncbi:hypothetical protein [Sorangium sp. So ce362]|uniref:hypothetical protein n=1 Tax=Sorangium sp. So ce362 TaxID=3133303 RepID=UPI003F60A86B